VEGEYWNSETQNDTLLIYFDDSKLGSALQVQNGAFRIRLSLLSPQQPLGIRKYHHLLLVSSKSNCWCLNSIMKLHLVIRKQTNPTILDPATTNPTTGISTSTSTSTTGSSPPPSSLTPQLIGIILGGLGGGVILLIIVCVAVQRYKQSKDEQMRKKRLRKLKKKQLPPKVNPKVNPKASPVKVAPSTKRNEKNGTGKSQNSTLGKPPMPTAIERVSLLSGVYQPPPEPTPKYPAYVGGLTTSDDETTDTDLA
jgi:hypothetical protein